MKTCFPVFGYQLFRKKIIRFSLIENLFSCFWITVIQENFAQILSDWKLVFLFLFVILDKSFQNLSDQIWIYRQFFAKLFCKFKRVFSFKLSFNCKRKYEYLYFIFILLISMKFEISFSCYKQISWICCRWQYALKANYICWISNSQNFRLLHDMRVCQNRPCALEHELTIVVGILIIQIYSSRFVGTLSPMKLGYAQYSSISTLIWRASSLGTMYLSRSKLVLWSKSTQADL